MCGSSRRLSRQGRRCLANAGKRPRPSPGAWFVTLDRTSGTGSCFAMKQAGGDFCACRVETSRRRSTRPPIWVRGRPIFVELNYSIHMIYRQNRTTSSPTSLPISGFIVRVRPVPTVWRRCGKMPQNEVRSQASWKRERHSSKRSCKFFTQQPAKIVDEPVTRGYPQCWRNHGTALALGFPCWLFARGSSSQSGLIKEFRITSSHLQGSRNCFAVLQTLLACNWGWRSAATSN
jgi:hypothetical protein